MSRFRRKTPIIGLAPSEKDDKKAWHRIFRRREKEACLRGDEIMPVRAEIEAADPWYMRKEGKYWRRKFTKFLRK